MLHNFSLDWIAQTLHASIQSNLTQTWKNKSTKQNETLESYAERTLNCSSVAGLSNINKANVELGKTTSKSIVHAISTSVSETTNLVVFT